MMRVLLAQCAIWLAFGLFVAACVLPAMEEWDSESYWDKELGVFASGHYVTVYGYVCLMTGWLALPAVLQGSLALLAWLANPLAYVSLLLLFSRRYSGAMAYGIASVLLGVLFLIVPPDCNDKPVLPQVGAWLWVGSLLALTVAAQLRRGSSKKHIEPVSQPIG